MKPLEILIPYRGYKSYLGDMITSSNIGGDFMSQQGLAVHETMEIHELLTFKTCCMTKSKTMQTLVSDQELKTMLQQDVQQSTRAINDLQSLLSRAQTQYVR